MRVMICDLADTIYTFNVKSYIKYGIYKYALLYMDMHIVFFNSLQWYK